MAVGKRAVMSALIGTSIFFMQSSALSQEGGLRPGDVSPSAIQEALTAISDCPAWSELQPGDAVTQRRIMACLTALRGYDLAVLGAAIGTYVTKLKREERYTVAAMSRLYVLNRYLFDVPERVPVGTRGFAGFKGVPSDAGGIDELWPFSRTPHGGLVLTGQFKGYNGEDYLAVEEFDYFRHQYGLRKLDRP
jgi:hypothetical protein